MEIRVPVFAGRRILKKESLWDIRDYTYAGWQLYYADHTDGLLKGCEIRAEDGRLVIGKGMMEPIFMGQLPELMKNYKDGETEILTGLEEKLQVVFQKAQQMQKADRKGKICTMGISYLQSSVLTENYELRIDLYDKEFYLDSAECCTYWKPEFVTGYLLQDVEYLKKEIRFKIPQIKTYELQQFIDGYLLNYMYLLAQFFQQILPQVLDKTKTLFQEVAEENMSVTFGEYMGKGIVVVGEREE